MLVASVASHVSFSIVVTTGTTVCHGSPQQLSRPSDSFKVQVTIDVAPQLVYYVPMATEVCVGAWGVSPWEITNQQKIEVWPVRVGNSIIQGRLVIGLVAFWWLAKLHV